MSQTNISTCNNLVVSGNQTISGNIISSGNIQTTNITSTNINNSSSITTNSINSNSGSLTNLSVSNILTLLSATPISFNYNGNQYNINALSLFNLFQLSGASIASQSYVQTQISNLINSSPALLDTLSELSNAINNDPNFNNTMLTLIATKASLSSDNNFTGTNNTFSNLPYYINTSDQLINKNYVDTRFTSLLAANNSFTGTNTISTANVTNLYSNILAINNNNVRRANNDIFEVATSSTGNYLYYNSASVFGHINTTNSAMSWYINSSGLASLPNLAIGSPNIRGSGDLLTVSVTPTGNYIYLNNGGVLGGYNTSGVPSFFPWTIDMVGLGTFRTVTTSTANITTDNVGTLNVSGTATITKLSINSSMRSNNDLFNCSTSSTGPYLFIGSDATIGTYNTNNSFFSLVC